MRQQLLRQTFLHIAQDRSKSYEGPWRSHWMIDSGGEKFRKTMTDFWMALHDCWTGLHHRKLFPCFNRMWQHNSSVILWRQNSFFRHKECRLNRDQECLNAHKYFTSLYYSGTITVRERHSLSLGKESESEIYDWATACDIDLQLAAKQKTNVCLVCIREKKINGGSFHL